MTETIHLADLATECLAIERHAAGRFPPSMSRGTTREMLGELALTLGIAPAEIEAAIDAAIKTAEAR